MRPADDLLLAAAFISFLFSIYPWFQGQREEGLFVGLWVPSILAFGGFVRSALQRLLDRLSLGYESVKVLARPHVLGVLHLLEAHPERTPLRDGSGSPHGISITTRHDGQSDGRSLAGARTDQHPQASVEARERRDRHLERGLATMRPKTRPRQCGSPRRWWRGARGTLPDVAVAKQQRGERR